jgi:eukaryotic-like serine/threonine-protein kinase
MSQASPNQRLRPFRPQLFGRYILLMPISTGGMGEVFLAQLQGPRGFDKLCVIKKILPHLAQDGDFVERFIDEARILVKLSHGSIAQVLDMGVNDGAPYIALEFVDGKDLRRVVSRMRERNLSLPMSFVLSVMVRVLDALAYAHRKRGDDDGELNLVHRDVSPQNVLISYEGEVKVIDFGLAKSAMSVSKTNPSIVLGKFMYMSPEQARHKPVDRRSDLYAVGLCLWELLTGKNPFEDVPSGELMGRVGNPSIPPLHTVEPLCPAALSEAVARALAIDPAQRFQSAEEFRGKLQSILQDIDPLAGAETTSRFMRDAFAGEYAAERRMLTTVKDQARALQPDDEPPAAPEEETAQNMPSPFAPKMTPLAIPAITMDDETPHANRLKALQPEALSFAPTPRTVNLESNLDEVHEKETLPAIQLKPELSVPAPVAPAPAPVTAPLAGAPSAPIRARVVTKSFDQESTEANAPAIEAPREPVMPEASIVVDGIPSEPFRTEQEIPAQVAPSPPPPRPSRGGPKTESRKAARPKSQPKAEARTPSKPPAKQAPTPQRTDTQVIERVVAEPPPAAPAAAPARKGGGRWVWLVVPVLALLGVGGYIVWDLTHAAPVEAEPVEEETVDASPPEPLQKPAPPAPAPEVVKDVSPPPPSPEPKEAEAPKPKSKPAPPKKAAGGSPVDVALRELKADLERVEDGAVAKRYTLQLLKLEADAADKGDDDVMLSRVEKLHAQIRAELAKPQ